MVVAPAADIEALLRAHCSLSCLSRGQDWVSVESLFPCPFVLYYQQSSSGDGHWTVGELVARGSGDVLLDCSWG